MQSLSLGYSPCPNDTFTFYALVHGRIASDGFSVRERLEDVETLNRLVLERALDISKIPITFSVLSVKSIACSARAGRSAVAAGRWSFPGNV